VRYGCIRAPLLSASEDRSAKREDFKLASVDGFPLLLADSAKRISPSLVVPDAVCRVEMAAVPGVGEGLVMCEPDAKLPPSESFVTFDLHGALLLVSDVELESVTELLLHVEQDVEPDSEEPVSDVELEAVEASLLRDELDDDCECEVTSEELVEDDCEVESEETAVACFCTFPGGSYANKTTALM